jgi:molybdopterin/thiamine biosynthesis adenylyltransferase
VLAGRSAVVFGLGAVGGITFEVLARLGVGQLTGVDPGEYRAVSAATQPMASTDVGKSKAWVQGQRARAANPAVQVRTAIGLAQDLPLRLLRQADFFVTAGDNLELVVWAGVQATALGKPLIQGAVEGETWTAIVRGYDLRQPDAACPACALGQRDWSGLPSRNGCDPASVPLSEPQRTRSLPNVCALAGHLAASEALKWLMGQEASTLKGEEIAYCLRTHRLWRTELPRRGSCRCPHEHWRIEDLQSGPAAFTPALLARRLGLPRTDAQLRAEAPWISQARCDTCGQPAPVRRFAFPGTIVGTCPCGKALAAGSASICSEVPAEDLDACWDTSLEELGVGAADAVGLSGGNGWTYFFFSSTPSKGAMA